MGMGLGDSNGTKERTFVLTYDDTPKSLNRGGAGSRRHWGAASKEKKHWEGIWGFLMIARKIPRRANSVYAEGLLEFATNNRRDVENFRPALVKPFADALVAGGWLPDDTDRYFRFGELRLLSGVVLGPHIKSRTTVTLEIDYA